jgi:isopentenyl phosphate kinase
MMITFVKLGGSLITDKRIEKGFRPEVAARLAEELRGTLDSAPNLRLLVGHGSGSFGHVAARKYGTINGVKTAEQWRGFAEVATAASELNFLMSRTLHEAGVPIWRIQPSASALSRDGVLIEMAFASIQAAFEHHLIPLVYGDVSLDETRGGTIISTETIFFYLAHHLPVNQILLLGDVDGVYDAEGKVIPQVTPSSLSQIESALGGSAGTDVTGGMETKVRDMVALVESLPHLSIRIMNGTQAGLLRDTLLGKESLGTLITAS